MHQEKPAKGSEEYLREKEMRKKRAKALIRLSLPEQVYFFRIALIVLSAAAIAVFVAYDSRAAEIIAGTLLSLVVIDYLLGFSLGYNNSYLGSYFVRASKQLEEGDRFFFIHEAATYKEPEDISIFELKEILEPSPALLNDYEKQNMEISGGDESLRMLSDDHEKQGFLFARVVSADDGKELLTFLGISRFFKV